MTNKITLGDAKEKPCFVLERKILALSYYKCTMISSHKYRLVDKFEKASLPGPLLLYMSPIWPYPT